MAAEACPRARWTTLGSAPAPSQMDAQVHRQREPALLAQPPGGEHLDPKSLGDLLDGQRLAHDALLPASLALVGEVAE
jgi:hypothetical protein